MEIANADSCHTRRRQGEKEMMEVPLASNKKYQQLGWSLGNSKVWSSVSSFNKQEGWPVENEMKRA